MAVKRVVIYNDQTYKQVNKDNKDILNDYILEMKSKRKAVKTIEQYVFDIKMFFCWAVDELDNKAILKLKKRDFRRFFLGMQERGASPARINRVQCSLRNMLEFCVEDDDIYDDYEINAMRSIKGVPKEEVREIVFLTNEQIAKIVDYLIEKEDYQKALYLTLSYESAGRRNEIYQVEKTDFLTSNRTNQVVGKRGKKFNLLYFKKSKELAEKWLEKRGEDNIPSLWVVGKGENRRQASYEALYDWTTRFRDILEEIEKVYLPFNPHSFRHCALENYKNGTHYVLNELGKTELPIEVLKILANHDSIETTQSYLKNNDEELLNEAFGI